MAQLTHEQLTANIDALKSKGASTSTIQGYLDSLKPPSLLKRAEDFGVNALPTIGGIAGGIAGGIGGAAAAGATTFGVGAPVGAFAGGVAGATAGGAAGEALKEKIQGKSLSPSNIGLQGGVQGAFEAVGGPIASGAGKVLEATGAGLAKMFIPKSEVEAGMLQAYKAGNSFVSRVAGVLGYGSAKSPGTSASTAFQQGLLGTESMIGVQALKAQKKLWNGLISPALKQAKETIDIPAFLKEAEDKIIKETNDPTRVNVLKNALNAIREDFKGIGKISLEQLQKYKEGWAEFVPEKAYKGQSISGALNDVRNTLAGMSREKIYNTLGDNVKQAYLDYSNLYGITKLGKQAMTGVTNIIKGGTGTSIKNILEHLTIPIGTIGGQTLYKVGQIAEFVGPAGVKTLGALLGIPSQTSSSSNSPQPTEGTPSVPNPQTPTATTTPPTQ